jgi:phenolic acid decarboxylase
MKFLFEDNPMLLIETSETQISEQLDYPSRNDELNRMLCAAVVSISFRKMLLSHPEIAVSSGYQGESFNLSDEDRNWLFSMRPANLVDLAANIVTYQQGTKQDSRMKLPVEPVPHLVRVN